MLFHNLRQTQPCNYITAQIMFHVNTFFIQNKPMNNHVQFVKHFT
jgi:hypothetical protein